jgi:hypothetical protein
MIAIDRYPEFMNVTKIDSLLFVPSTRPRREIAER